MIKINKFDVVVIDDDEGIIWLMEEILSGKYSYETCQSGLTGLQSIERNQPRMAIIDLKLGGGMNGLDVARKISEKCKQISIIFLTGYKKAVLENLDQHLPVINVIEKPFDVIGLMNIVDKVLGKKKSI